MKRTGYRAASTIVYSQVHHALRNPANGPIARRTQTTYPPSTGIAGASSHDVKASGIAHTSGVTRMRSRASSGPVSATNGSRPIGPPLTQQKTVNASASGESDRALRSRWLLEFEPAIVVGVASPYFARSMSRISVSNVSCADGAGGASGAASSAFLALFTARTTTKSASETMMNPTTAFAKRP